MNKESVVHSIYVSTNYTEVMEEQGFMPFVGIVRRNGVQCRLYEVNDQELSRLPAPTVS